VGDSIHSFGTIQIKHLAHVGLNAFLFAALLVNGLGNA
jgi:hypothetical protein